MDTRDGRIYMPEELRAVLEKMTDEDKQYLKPMAVTPTEKQLLRKPPKVGRNEACPCGSGKKFKKCCLVT